jgi:hypothetical protein
VTGQAPGCVGLLADKVLEVGRVCAAERGDTLVVSYRGTAGWLLAETHLTLAPSRDSVPLAGGRQPILGRFLRIKEHQPALEEVTYRFARSEVPADENGRVFVVAHATMTRGAEERGAWGAGTSFTPAGSPATFFVYQRVSRPEL